jgi:hypothetical protein
MRERIVMLGAGAVGRRIEGGISYGKDGSDVQVAKL